MTVDEVAGVPDCLFCGVVAGAVPARVVHEGAHTLAFRDLHPVARTHLLVVPREHHEDVAALAAADPGLLGVLAAAAQVARLEGLDDRYLLVTNTGRAAGRTVQHLHVHVLVAATWADRPAEGHAGSASEPSRISLGALRDQRQR